MQDLTAEPEVDIDVDPETGEFSILTGDDLKRARHHRWDKNDYEEQFWDERLA